VTGTSVVDNVILYFHYEIYAALCTSLHAKVAGHPLLLKGDETPRLFSYMI